MERKKKSTISMYDLMKRFGDKKTQNDLMERFGDKKQKSSNVGLSVASTRFTQPTSER